MKVVADNRPRESTVEAASGPALGKMQMMAPRWQVLTTHAGWLLTTSILLTGTTGAGAAPKAPSSEKSPDDVSRLDADAASERDAIIQRLRCEGIDPTECLIPDPLFGDTELPMAWVDPDGNPVPVNDATIELLIEAAGDRLIDHEAEPVADAGAELTANRYSELQFFGVSDHFVDPPHDYYRDPVKCVTRAPMLYLDEIDPADFDIPLVVNSRVQDWMVYFLTRGRKHFTKWLGRKTRYEPFISQALAEAGLPQDLIYQSMIESGFSPYAYSWAKAAGIWQFIPSTGRRFDMQIDWWVDQRRDPYQATKGAIGYMQYLYGLFGDWHLASAAYNAGEGKIGRAIRRYETRNFWELCQGDYLKPETKDYVPKIIAAAILGKYADRYGLNADVPEWHDPWEFDVVTVPEATDVGLIAEITGGTEESILEMNPALRRWCTPPGAESWDVRIPLGTSEGFHEALAAIPPEKRLTFKRYKVSNGDTLSKIADKYGVSMNSILKLNTIPNANRISVGQYLVIPVRAESTRTQDLIHEVVRGDSLSQIAQRYGATVSQLRDWNGLSGDTINVGQRLKVQVAARVTTTTAVAEASDTQKKQEPAAESSDSDVAASDAGDAVADAGDADDSENADDGEQAEEPTAPTARSETEKKAEPARRQAQRRKKPHGESMMHSVSNGDTLGALASHYDVPLDELMGWNELSSHIIYVGQKLTVYPGPQSATRRVKYKVKKGDTLWEIASTHGVSVSDLQEWNSLGRRSTIRIGQKITIYSGSGGKRAAARTRNVTHSVVSGETLWEIARQYGVSVDALKKWNDLSRDTVYIGQNLTVKR